MRLLAGIAITLIFSILLIGGCSPSPRLPENFSQSEATDSDEEHEYSVNVEGSEMRMMTIRQIADLWQIDANKLLDNIMVEFDLKNQYTVDSVLDDLRKEYKFSPSMVKDIAEGMK